MDWLREVSTITKKNNNAIHRSTKMTPLDGSNKVKEETVYSNLQNKRQKRAPKCKIEDLLRTADIEKIFS